MITQEIKDAWIADLRANPDKKGVGSLETRFGNFCCLGRLALVIRDQFPTHFPSVEVGTHPIGKMMVYDTENEGDLCEPQSKLQGLPISVLPFSFQAECVTNNDDKKWSFVRIADWLEATPLDKINNIF